MPMTICKRKRDPAATSKKGHKLAKISPESAASETLWGATSILKENDRKYFIAWKGVDPATGEAYKPTWEPKRNANRELVKAWKKERQKDLKERLRISQGRTRRATQLLDIPTNSAPEHQNFLSSIEAVPAVLDFRSLVPVQERGAIVNPASFALREDDHIDHLPESSLRTVNSASSPSPPKTRNTSQSQSDHVIAQQDLKLPVPSVEPRSEEQERPLQYHEQAGQAEQTWSAKQDRGVRTNSHLAMTQLGVAGLPLPDERIRSIGIGSTPIWTELDAQTQQPTREGALQSQPATAEILLQKGQTVPCPNIGDRNPDMLETGSQTRTDSNKDFAQPQDHHLATHLQDTAGADIYAERRETASTGFPEGEGPGDADTNILRQKDRGEDFRLQSLFNQECKPTGFVREENGKNTPIDNDDAGQLMAQRRKFDKSGRVSHICRDCRKEFMRPCDLAKHEKTHSRPWKCPETECKYHEQGWPTEKERDRHVNDKHSDTPSLYQCFYCGYSSKRDTNRKQHMEKVHGWEYIRSKRNGQKKNNFDRGLYKIPETGDKPTSLQPDYRYQQAYPLVISGISTPTPSTRQSAAPMQNKTSSVDKAAGFTVKLTVMRPTSAGTPGWGKAETVDVTTDVVKPKDAKQAAPEPKEPITDLDGVLAESSAAADREAKEANSVLSNRNGGTKNLAETSTQMQTPTPIVSLQPNTISHSHFPEGPQKVSSAPAGAGKSEYPHQDHQRQTSRISTCINELSQASSKCPQGHRSQENEHDGEGAPRSPHPVRQTVEVDTQTNRWPGVTQGPSETREPLHQYVEMLPKNAAPYSSYFGDLNEWLEITGYHDRPYRHRVLQRNRVLVELKLKRPRIGCETRHEDKAYFACTQSVPAPSAHRMRPPSPPPPPPMAASTLADFSSSVTRADDLVLRTSISAAQSGPKRERSPSTENPHKQVRAENLIKINSGSALRKDNGEDKLTHSVRHQETPRIMIGFHPASSSLARM